MALRAASPGVRTLRNALARGDAGDLRGVLGCVGGCMRESYFREGDLFAYLQPFGNGECGLMLSEDGAVRISIRLTASQAKKLSELLAEANDVAEVYDASPS